MKKGAETVFQEIRKKIGTEGIEKVLNVTFPDESDKVSKIMKIFEQKQASKADKSKDFRSFLKQ